MKTIAIINQKGGVAKTSTAASIGAGLHRRGNKVLLIDLDPQRNLTYSMQAESVGALEILLHPGEIEARIQETPSGIDFIGAAERLAGAEGTFTQTGKEYRLKESLQHIEGKYDYCIIDTPPSVGLLTVNALTAASGCIIPAQPDIYSQQGIIQLKETIENVRTYCNPALKVYGILLTRWNGRTTIAKNFMERIEGEAAGLDTTLFNTKIRECVSLRESQAMQQSIFEYDPKSNAAADYDALIDEILERA